MPSERKDGTKANISLNLTLSSHNYTAMYEGLRHLTIFDDAKFIDSIVGIEDLVKWVIKGSGSTDYFYGYVFNSLLPDGVGSACPVLENCQVNYDETCISVYYPDYDLWIDGLYCEVVDPNP